MKKIIIDKLTTIITNNKKCSKKDIVTYKYGLETLYNLITKTIVIIIVTAFTKTLKECLLLIIIYSSLRMFAYGLHASGSLTCWITTLPIYIGGSFLVKYISLPKYIFYIIWLIYFFFIFLWAPADTKKRPLIREERRKKLKRNSIIVCLIYLVIIILTKYSLITNVIGFCMLLESICICPLSYYITGNKFNNYIYYLQEHGLN